MLQQFKVLTCFIACFALVFVTFKKVTPFILFETNSLTNRKQKSYKNPISPRPNQGVDKVSLTNKHFLLSHELSFSAQQLALFSIVKIRCSEKMSYKEPALFFENLAQITRKNHSTYFNHNQCKECHLNSNARYL